MAVRPAMLYGLEAVTDQKNGDSNEYIKRTLQIKHFGDLVRVIRWFEHVHRRDGGICQEKDVQDRATRQKRRKAKKEMVDVTKGEMEAGDPLSFSFGCIPLEFATVGHMSPFRTILCIFRGSSIPSILRTYPCPFSAHAQTIPILFFSLSPKHLT